jgi:hypothetical protein
VCLKERDVIGDRAFDSLRFRDETSSGRHALRHAENGGPLMFTRMGMMRAINRHKVEEFDPKQKSPHWEKRKLRRDQ